MIDGLYQVLRALASSTPGLMEWWISVENVLQQNSINLFCGERSALLFVFHVWMSDTDIVACKITQTARYGSRNSSSRVNKSRDSILCDVNKQMKETWSLNTILFDFFCVFCWFYSGVFFVCLFVQTQKWFFFAADSMMTNCFVKLGVGEREIDRENMSFSFCYFGVSSGAAQRDKKWIWHLRIFFCHSSVSIGISSFFTTNIPINNKKTRREKEKRYLDHHPSCVCVCVKFAFLGWKNILVLQIVWLKTHRWVV